MLLLSRAKLLVLSNELLLQLYASPIFMLEFASSVTIGSFVFLVFLACLCVCVCVCVCEFQSEGMGGKYAFLNASSLTRSFLRLLPPQNSVIFLHKLLKKLFSPCLARFRKATLSFAL
jgi:hypothetical protein